MSILRSFSCYNFLTVGLDGDGKKIPLPKTYTPQPKSSFVFGFVIWRPGILSIIISNLIGIEGKTWLYSWLVLLYFIFSFDFFGFFTLSNVMQYPFKPLKAFPSFVASSLCWWVLKDRKEKQAQTGSKHLSHFEEMHYRLQSCSYYGSVILKFREPFAKSL